VYCYYPQEQYSGTPYIHHASSCQHGRFIPFFLIPFLPTFLPPTLYWALFFSLFLACSKGIKMGPINSKRTSVCIAKVDVIKDLMPLPLSLFPPSPGLNHPHFYYIPSPIIIYNATSPRKFIKFPSLSPMICVFLKFITLYRSLPS
jgi:hypothetical protein